MRSTYEVTEVNEGIVFLVDCDIGGKSVTNDAENVVKELIAAYGSRMVFVYRDSMNEWDELKHDGVRFTGFAPYRFEKGLRSV